MKNEIDDNTLRLVGGLIDVITSLVMTLEAHGVMDRESLAYIISRRLDEADPDALEAAPMAVLLNWLRPQEPPRPQLRLIRGGKT